MPFYEYVGLPKALDVLFRSLSLHEHQTSLLHSFDAWWLSGKIYVLLGTEESILCKS